MSEWISVDQQLPKYGESVLIVENEGRLPTRHVAWLTLRGWVREGDLTDYAVFDVTHWMPLPETPE